MDVSRNMTVLVSVYIYVWVYGRICRWVWCVSVCMDMGKDILIRSVVKHMHWWCIYIWVGVWVYVCGCVCVCVCVRVCMDVHTFWWLSVCICVCVSVCI